MESFPTGYLRFKHIYSIFINMRCYRIARNYHYTSNLRRSSPLLPASSHCVCVFIYSNNLILAHWKHQYESLYFTLLFKFFDYCCGCFFFFRLLWCSSCSCGSCGIHLGVIYNFAEQSISQPKRNLFIIKILHVRVYTEVTNAVDLY